MKQVIGLSCAAMFLVLVGNEAPAASGKCTVTDVDGNRMVVECQPAPKGFVKGTKIKIKSDKDKAEEGG